MPLFPTEIAVIFLLWLWLRLRNPSLGARAVPWLLFASLGALCLRFAVLELLMVYRIYDDEGYVLYSLHNHFAGASLYDEVQSLYGPFLFMLARLLHLVGFDAIHDHGRALTLVYWLGLVAGAGGLTWKLSRSLAATTVCVCFSTVYLRVLADEPMHPVALISVLAMGAAWLCPGQGTHPRLRSFLVGLAAGALLLTKLNTGIFLVAGSGLWWLWTRKQQGKAENAAFLAACGVLLAMPFLLMRSFLGFEGVALHVLVASLLLAGGLLVAAHQAADSPSSGLSGLAWLIGLLVSLLAGSGYALGTGTSLQGLMDGILLSHLRNLTYFHVAMPWLPGTALLSCACTLLCLFSHRLPRRAALLATTLPSLVALTGLMLAWNKLLPYRLEAVFFSLALPAACTCLIPLQGSKADGSLRFWIFLLGATQSLHAFPVAGTHLACGSILLLPLLCARCAEGLAMLPLPRQEGMPGRALRIALIAYCVLTLGLHLREQGFWFPTRRALDLPGARTLQLSPALTSTLRVLETNARVHGTRLYSEPGLFSFNLWSGVATPTGQNVTNWFKLLTPEAMGRIGDSLVEKDGAVVIREDLNKRSLVDASSPPTALEKTISTRFRTLFTLGSHHFLVRAESRAAALDIMEVYTTPGRDRMMVEFIHPFPEEGAVLASAELLRLTGYNTDSPVPGTGSEAAVVESWPATPDGMVTADAQLSQLPFLARGTRKVRIHLPMTPGTAIDPSLLLILRDAGGGAIAYVRMSGPVGTAPAR